ncbi:type I phosphomannose isomerase catalytic subunit [Acetohalobium arabaticum]|uniref:Phosphohexomutase n=1 Tax=Acetohalobium arabaticum (strain ATCC 49924 / DSM 5501 / Z-7288) TaxID=574087 RepID=D9QTQ9_ACEAZ|nr:type I phosphomannose isomerase catalytic subunit [Acetohalobium arabaticum]ADL13630.1 mannose-6-phosphate isomerase, type 1 [Acetohalobium arabaticum DSM 5501]
MFYPLKFEPIHKEKIWGGNRLAAQFDRSLPADKIGESWELAAHENGTSIVSNGCFKGEGLPELIDKYWAEIMGQEIERSNYDKFPLLIKLLDANDKLSIQVHPDDEYAAKYNIDDSGKNELWYIIDAKPDAELIYGLQPDMTKEEFATSIEDGRLIDKLNSISVNPGDVVFIPAGTVHAIKEGILLAEIQQNSDTTYRIYDWDRVGSDGNPRELHIKEALEAIDFNRNSYEKCRSIKLTEDNYQRKILAISEYFITERIKVENSFRAEPKKRRFEVLLSLTGQAEVSYSQDTVTISRGETVLIPAQLDSYQLNGKTEVLRTYISSDIEKFKAELKAKEFTDTEIAKITF